MTQAELEDLLQRFESSQATEADRQLLRQLFLANGQAANEQTVQQLGKYGVNVEEGKDIHIGDIIQEGSSELIRAIVQELLAFQKQLENGSTGLSENISVNEPVELIEIEPQVIQQVNFRLASIKELQSAQHLTDSQQTKLNTLRNKVKSLSDVDQKLREIASNADQLLQDAVKSLTDRLKELNNSETQSLMKLNSENCLGQQAEVIQEFRRELEEGKKIAEWLNERRPYLAEVIGQNALNANSSFRETVSVKQTEDFYFTIEQFLECLSHSLIWGNSSILETPKIPKIFDDEIYSAAFQHLKEIIPKRFSKDGLEQLNEYLDCLLENLPFCPKLKT